MKAVWLVGLMLLIQQNQFPEAYTVTDHGKAIAVVNRSDITLPLPGLEVLSTDKFDDLLNQLDKQIRKKPENAKLDDADRIVPEEVGYKLNRHGFTEQFYHYFYNKGPSSAEVPKLYLYPKIDSELLSMIRVKHIGQYVTYYNSRNKSRSNNISLAINAIDNHVVFPGETFSFNEVVGKRTEEKGYMKAPEIIKGALTEGIGGGICQVSSTLFNAVDRTGLTVVERYSHSKHVPYVPPGRDATVSWYGPDFAFRNEYNQPILIRGKAANGIVNIRIYSSDAIEYYPRVVPGVSVSIEDELWMDFLIKK